MLFIGKLISYRWHKTTDGAFSSKITIPVYSGSGSNRGLVSHHGNIGHNTTNRSKRYLIWRQAWNRTNSIKGCAASLYYSSTSYRWMQKCFYTYLFMHGSLCYFCFIHSSHIYRMDLLAARICEWLQLPNYDSKCATPCRTNQREFQLQLLQRIYRFLFALEAC